MMVSLRFFTLLVVSFLLVQCETPPPGTVVFDGENNADEVVMEYHGISKDDLEGYKIIPIETQSIRNPQDSTAVYVPRIHEAANFQ